MIYAYSENYVLPISHDEVVHGKGSLLRKMPGDRWQQLANLRAYLAYMWAHPGKQLLFMGSEFGQDAEWAESRSLDWWHLDDPAHRGILQLVTDLNARYKELDALWSQDVDPAGFQWIDANDATGNVLSFLRTASLRAGRRGRARRWPAWRTSRRSPHHGLPDRAAPRRALARGAQHRRRGLRRLGRRQLRRRRGRRGALARPAVLGDAARLRRWAPSGSCTRAESGPARPRVRRAGASPSRPERAFCAGSRSHAPASIPPAFPDRGVEPG